MKKNKLTTAVIAGLAGVAGVASVGYSAVHVNPEGTGQVLIYPYYTVNNGLNTTYSVVNTTNEAKAIKVRFLEGQHSREVLDFNVYLSAYDVWVGALGGVTSTINDGARSHVGENSGAHGKSDNSCAPFLPNVAEFLPYEIEKDAGNDDMQRATDGHFEVLEMATIVGPSAVALTHVGGVPANCAQLEAAWDGGYWDLAAGGDPTVDTGPVTGGLFGGASIVDVAEGFNVSYEAIAIDGFWAGNSGQHTNPGSLAPGLGQADLTATVFNNGNAETSTWAAGAQAVSSLFMRDEVYNEYSFEAAVNGKSEWVITFPTKFFHVDPNPAIPPFSETWDGFESCETFTINVWDREEQVTPGGGGGVSPPRPGGQNPQFCYEANVLEFISPNGSLGTSNVLGGNNLQSVKGVNLASATESGWARINFSQASQSMSPDIGTTYEGLPVTGFMVQKYTNNNAQPGALAQYGGLFDHKGRITSAN